jgi:hypothetical protein
MATALQRLSNWYWKYERRLSSLGIISGFLFDIFTLTRVDQTLENIWVGFHLIVAAVGILMLNLYEEGKLKAKVPGRAHFWWTFVIQFAFGGLFSVYLVFYSRSANFFASWPFLLVLALNFIANERLRERYARADFQMTTLFLGILFYNIYIVPIILKSISTEIFIVSGLISLALMGLYIFLLSSLTPKRLWKERWVLFGSILGSFLLINILYFTDLIPPIPLSLKQAGVYHSIYRDSNSASGYTALDEYQDNEKWYRYFLPAETIHLAAGQTAYVYTAIFAPTNFATSIVHRWLLYDPAAKKWLTESRVPLTIRGGRDNGYRTFSLKGNLTPGKWRVSVETSSGQVIGRLDFRVEPAAFPPILQEVNL